MVNVYKITKSKREVKASRYFFFSSFLLLNLIVKNSKFQIINLYPINLTNPIKKKKKKPKKPILFSLSQLTNLII